MKLKLSEEAMTPDEFTEEWIGWIPEKGRNAFALQARALAGAATTTSTQPFCNGRTKSCGDERCPICSGRMTHEEFHHAVAPTQAKENRND